MAKRNRDTTPLSPAEQKALAKFEELLAAARRQQWLKTPQHIRELGKILRRSVVKDTTVKLRRFLKKHNVRVRKADLEAFRDVLIVNRVDLKDLEPEARARLRARTLATEDVRRMSIDYRNAVHEDGRPPHCRDCRWFVTAPNDGEPDGDKACVEFGTKGADLACMGFTRQAN